MSFLSSVLATPGTYNFRALTFVWPHMLWLLIAVPLLMTYYLRLISQRKHAGVRYTGLALAGPGAESLPIRLADAPQTRFGRWSATLKEHVPAILLFAGLAMMIIAIARPHAVIVLPARVDAIILAMDASGSMRATDIKPTRLVAAQTAAKAFIAEQPSQVRIGVVSIAATASLVQSPTDKRDDILRAIDRFQLQPGSALGSGLVIALTTLLPSSGIDAQKIIGGKDAAYVPRDWQRQTETYTFKPVPPGSNSAAAIVLVSDGESNTGPDLLEAGKLAAERGVRVFTVGIGTTEGAVLSVDGWSMRVRLDEEKLKKLADMTRGEYFRAGSAAELKGIYKHLSAKVALGKGRETEITALFVALGIILAVCAAMVSMLRSNRIL
jgi:Ca-activated chloride channel family protein